MDPTNEKLCLLFGMLIMTLICSVVPRMVGQRFQIPSNILDYCSCISGGIFIGALFLDLIPDVKEAFESLNILGDHADLPLPEFVICLGFFLPFFIEQTILCFKKSGEQTPSAASSTSGSNEERVENEALIHGIDCPQHQANHGSLYGHLRSLMLLIALSFHSIFEGLAIGLQEDFEQLISLFFAVITHKALMAFSFALNLRDSKLPFFAVSILIFACASPFGIAIGIFISDLQKTSNAAVEICSAFLQAISAGTFLFVTFVEVLPTQFSSFSNQSALLKLFFLFIGFMLIVVQIMTLHD